MTPTLAQIVKKWHKTYSAKQQWSFSYEHDDKEGKDNLNVGYLSLTRDSYSDQRPVHYPAILIEGNIAVIGEYRSLAWGHGSEWHKTYQSGIELVAADPRFFPKLERAMQFLTRARSRRAENEKKFQAEEMVLLKKVLE